MLYLFTGTDRMKAREAMRRAIEQKGKGCTIVTITDAHAPTDAMAAMRGGGMFAEKRVVVFDSAFANEEIRAAIMNALPIMWKNEDVFFIFESKLDVATRKTLEKHAEKSEKFDVAKEREDSNVFAIANALRRGDKKGAWVTLVRELEAGKAPEAIHGLMFWAAKQMVLTGRGAEKEKGEKLVAELAEIPHEARRRGFDLDYALEHFVLSRM